MNFKQAFSAGLLTTFLALGGIFTFTLPPFQLPDEQHHWVLALQRMELITQRPGYFGTWKALPDFFDINRVHGHINEKMPTDLFQRVDSVVPQPLARSNIVYGTLFSYPQVSLVTIMPGWVPTSGVAGIVAFYLARLLAGLFTFIPLLRLVQLTWNNNHPGSLSVLALAVFPLFVQQSFAVSSDVVCNVFALWIVVILIGENRLRTIDWSLCVVFGLLACSTKPMMAIAGIAAAAAYWLKHGSIKRWQILLVILVLILSSALAIGLFFKFASRMPNTRFLIDNFSGSMTTMTIGFVRRFSAFADFCALSWMEFYPDRIAQSIWFVVLALAFWADEFVPRSIFFKPSWPQAKVGTFIATFLIVGGLAHAASITLLMYGLYGTRSEPFFSFLQTRYFFPSMILVGIGVFAFLEVFKAAPLNAAAAIESFSAKQKSAGRFSLTAGLVVALVYINSIHSLLVRRFW